MSLPIGLSYPAWSASTTPLDNGPRRPRKFKLRRALLSSKKRASAESADSLASSNSSVHSPVSPSSVPRYSFSSTGQAVAPKSPCTSVGLSSSRTSTFVSSNSPSLSSSPLSSPKSVGDSSSVRSRHVEIVIPDWALPIQRFSSSPIDLSFELQGLRTSVSTSDSPPPASMAATSSSRNNFTTNCITTLLWEL
jgi:hypothetical protein